MGHAKGIVQLGPALDLSRSKEGRSNRGRDDLQVHLDEGVQDSNRRQLKSRITGST